MTQMLKREFGDPTRRWYVFFAIWALVICTVILFVEASGLDYHNEREYKNTVIGKERDYLLTLYPADSKMRDIAMNDEQLSQKRNQLLCLRMLEFAISKFLEGAVEPALIVGFGGYAIDWLFKWAWRRKKSAPT